MGRWGGSEVWAEEEVVKYDKEEEEEGRQQIGRPEDRLTEEGRGMAGESVERKWGRMCVGRRRGREGGGMEGGSNKRGCRKRGQRVGWKG